MADIKAYQKKLDRLSNNLEDLAGAVESAAADVREILIEYENDPESHIALSVKVEMLREILEVSKIEWISVMEQKTTQAMREMLIKSSKAKLP